MSRVSCPGCGKAVDREALECPHCGVPVLAMLGPRSSRLHPGVIVMLIVTGGLGLMMVVGIVAVLVIQRISVAEPGASAFAEEEQVDFAEPPVVMPALLATDSAVVREGIRALVAAYDLQQSYLISGGGEYATNLDDRSAPGFLTGWEDPDLKHYEFRVSRDTNESGLCIEAVPVSTTAYPLSIDDAESVYFGLGCDGTPQWESPREEWLDGD